MNRGATVQKIVERLREPYETESAPEPPEELRGAILSEVPERLELSPEVASRGGAAGSGNAGPRRWVLAAAASLIVAVGAGVVAVRVMDEEPMTGAVPRRDEVAEQPPKPAEETADRRAAPAREETDVVEPTPAVEATPRASAPLLQDQRDRAASAPSERSAGERGAGRQLELEKVPTARDPWEVVTRTPGAPSDRIQVDGEGEGRQDAFAAPGESGEDATFEVDGVVITDQAAIGSSPTSHEFEALGERRAEPPARGREEAANLSVEQGNERIASMERERRVLEAELRQLDEFRGVPKPKSKQIPFPASEPAPSPPAHVAPSTGGTAEPNDQPYGDVFFRSYGTNPFLDTEDDPLSTFALDVDTGSYGVVRRYLSDGHLPPPEAVRVEELVNAFDYGDPAPSEGEGDFALIAEGSRSPFMAGERYHLVRFAVKAREVSAADRKPAVLTFVVDVSGSMAREDRLGLVKRALGLLLGELRSDDRVALVIYGSRGGVVLDHTGDLAAIRRAIDRLRPEGSTNAEEGLTLGYDLARRAFREGAINRVILCSDGVANVGATGPDSILERIGDEARRGVELTTVGFGMGNYNDVLMERLADQGDGAYAYVDTLDEARRVFVENLTGTLQTVARDAKVQVEFDPAVVARYRLLGYENRDVPDELFRDDTVDAGEVGAGHTVTALYEVKLRPDARPRATAATLHLRWRSAETGRVEEVARPIAVRELRRAWDEAPRALRLASVVAELAEILKGSYWAREGDLDDLFRRAQKLSAEYPGDLRVAELATLVGKAAALSRP